MQRSVWTLTFPLIFLAMLGSGCAARKAPDARALGRADAIYRGKFQSAQQLNHAVDNSATLARLQHAQSCRAGEHQRSHAAALREARALVKRAKTAPASEQAAIERRAGELLEELQSF